MLGPAMPTARLAHTFLFVCDLERMIAFYVDALGFTREDTADAGFVMLRGTGGGDLALHRVPDHVAAAIGLTSPAAWRDDSAMKLCFATDDLDAARRSILDHGGQAKSPWSWEGRAYCECADPEGNVVQLFAPAPT